MSFLNQLKSQAQTLQAQAQVEQQCQTQQTEAVERVTQQVWRYLDELAAHLRVLQPDGPRLTLDGKIPWPALRATDFRCDARRKNVGDRELFDYVIMAWRLTPKMGVVVQGSVSSVLLADTERIATRLHAAQVQFERTEIRVPPKNALQSVRHDYQTEARASVTVQPNHSAGELEFRLVCVNGMDTVRKVIGVQSFTQQCLDELAKLIVGQPNTFL